jgi:hypothetical protein
MKQASMGVDYLKPQLSAKLMDHSRFHPKA